MAAIGVSLAYLTLTLLIGRTYALFPFLTALLLFSNFGLSLNHLFLRGKITPGMVLLNVIQLALFCELHAQIHTIFGADHYAYAVPPRWYDWAELVAVHALRAVDLLDVMEAYGIRLQNVSNRSVLSGMVLFVMHIMVDVFIIGAVLNALERGSRSRIPRGVFGLAKEFVEFAALPKDIRHWGILATTGLMVLVGYVADCMNGMRFFGNWLLYPLDNVLRTLDFGDAFQIFGWRLHGVDMGKEIATLAVYYRLLIASATIGIVNRAYLRLMEGRGKTVEDLEAICLSPGYDREERLIAVKALKNLDSDFAFRLTPQLASALGDRRGYQDAAPVLREIGQEAVPCVIKAMLRCHRNMRGLVAGLLEEIDPYWYRSRGAYDTVPDMVKAAASPDLDTHLSALRILGDIDPDWPRSRHTAKALPHLMRSLGDPNPKAREASAEVLGLMGPSARKAVFHLVRALADTKPAVRRAAAEALGQVDREWPRNENAHNAIPYLVKGLTSPDRDVRSVSAKILEIIDTRWPGTQGARNAAFHLEERMEDDNEEIRQAAKTAWERIVRAS